MSKDHVQTVRNAWINRVRDEALRMHRPEVSKAVQIGILIATYADADGSHAFPSAATLAAIAGCSEETVTRCVRLLMAVGLLMRKRRPNASAMYQLLIPTKRPEWEEHLHVWGTSRQARARQRAKAREMAEHLAEDTGRNPSGDGIRNPSAVKVPEPDRGRGPSPSGTRPRTGAEPVPGRVPEPVPGGPYQYTPTSGRDPDSDQETVELPPQPQVRAGARPAKDPDPAIRAMPEPQPDVPRCAVCGGALAIRRSGRTGHERCADRPPSAVQPPLLLGVPSPQPEPEADAATQPQADTA